MEDDGPPPGEEEEYVDALGVITALERTCELEARLRQAIQDTHPLTTTLDWDFNAADREREGLLAIRCAAMAGVLPPGGGVRPPPSPTAATCSRVCGSAAAAAVPVLQLARIWLPAGPAVHLQLRHHCRSGIQPPLVEGGLPHAVRVPTAAPCMSLGFSGPLLQRAAGVPGGQAAGIPLPGANRGGEQGGWPLLAAPTNNRRNQPAGAAKPPTCGSTLPWQ